MLDRKALQALGCWTGYWLERVEWPQGEERTLSLYLKPVSKIMYCEQCRARVTEPDWSTIRYLAMDEFALHKGHRYATVVVDPIGRQVL